MIKHVVIFCSVCFFLHLSMIANAGVLPVVSLVPGDAEADEATLSTAGFRVLRTNNGDIGDEFIVDIQLSGTAFEGLANGDYLISNVIAVDPEFNIYGAVIPANSTVTSVLITPLKDNLVEGTEQALFTIVDGTFNNYDISADNEVTVDILDDPALISITLEDGDADEKGQDSGGVTIRQTGGNPKESMIVWLEVTGTATREDDFTDTELTFNPAPGLFIEIPEGEESLSVKVTPEVDNLNEGTETAIYTIIDDLFNDNYLVGAPNTAEISIEDDIAVVSITGEAGLAKENGPVEGSVKINRNDDGNPGDALDVLIEISGSAELGVDYTVDAEFWDPPNIYRKTIPAAESNVALTITPITDLDVEGDEEVVITLSPAQLNNYYPGAPTQSVITIQDLIDDMFRNGFETP